MRPARVQRLELNEPDNRDGAVRLVLTGELDLADAGRLAARLAELARRGRPVYLDLSGLQFLDWSGLRVIRDALADARRSAWSLKVDPETTPLVRRVIEVTDSAPELWPSR